MDIDNSVTRVKKFLLQLQKDICHFLEKEDSVLQWQEDKWQHGTGGGGLSKVITSGAFIEKAGVNFSHVSGKQLPLAATAKRPELANTGFQALGVSVVIHPLNPYVPTTHMNVRFFITDSGVWWFGGGFDLTPYYGFEEDCQHWHQMAKAACDPFGSDVYSRFKKWCDDYFYLQHRQEPRGIGGLFFDDLQAWGFETCFDFMRGVGEYFIKAYQPILAKRKLQAYTHRERDFQLYRRGRYTEFNLLYDRGTLFGLQSNGRVESILMSLPPIACWKYNWSPEQESAEADLYEKFLCKKEWV